MQKTNEKEILTVEKYDLSIIIENTEQKEKIQKTIELINESNDHMINFHHVASIVDGGFAKVERLLSKDENDKIYDLNISGQFDEANKLEEQAKCSWEVSFLKHAA